MLLDLDRVFAKRKEHTDKESSAITGVVAYRWITSNKESLVEKGQAIKEEAQAFAQNKTDAEVLAEALRRHRECVGFLCNVQNKVFLSAGLDASRHTEDFCRDVPSATYLVRSVLYRLAQCQELGLNVNYCGNLFDEVQKHCDKRNQ